MRSEVLDAYRDRGQDISYTCFGRPSRLNEGGRSAAFTYNGSNDRVKMYVADGTSAVLTRYYIGGITHITTADGVLVAEYSYDAWGRLRNPETHEIYLPGQEPELFLGRGFTGHEHLSWFGLINMNARLYDPVIGRVLSPDPYVQIPDFTQNFNRYSYGLNNPLVYIDENGEFVITTAVIIGIAVGAAIGAAAGVYAGYKMAESKGATGWEKAGYMIGGGLIGGLAGAAGAYAGAAVGASMAAAGVGGFLAGAATGGVGGATAGFINGFGMSMLNNPRNVGGAFMQGVYQAGIGGLSGAAIGGLVQGTASAIKGNNFWDGSSSVSVVDRAYGANESHSTDKSYSVYKGVDKVTGETKYVGITKRNPEIRFAEHLHSKTPKATLNYSVVESGFNQINARTYEQKLINLYGLNNLYNKINSIAPKYWNSYNIKP